MKFSWTYFVIFGVIFCFLFVSVWALSGDQKWHILRSFKEKEFDLIFESDIWDISSEDISVFNISKKLDLYSSIRERVSDSIEEKQRERNVVLNEILSLERSIASLDEEITWSTDNVAKINAKIIEVKNDIASSKNTVTLLRKKISENREILLEYLVYIFKKSQLASGETEFDTLKSIMLQDQNITDVINDLYFKWLLQVTWKKLVDKHRAYVSELYLKQLSLEKEEEELKKLRKTEIVERKILQDKKQFKERILVASKWKETLYQDFIEDKIEVEKNLRIKEFQEQIKFNTLKNELLKKYGCEFVDVSQNTIEFRSLTSDCLNINKLIASESLLKDISPDAEWNIFTWPVFPSLWISAYFTDAGYIDIFWDDHDAIDIVAPQWSLIKAPADGYVTHITYPESPDYSFLSIKHANGYVTVYGHLSEILVDEFDYVKKWQVFAKTWWEFGTNGAGFLTTGPHLHFAVYYNKEYKDPLNYLDLSYLSYEYLPQKYRFKYYADFRERRGYEFQNKTQEENTFRIEWDTEIERQKYLIQTYARSDFRDWNMWVQESLDWGIDPTFVMCIGLAESGLGRNMKTPYNVWNVWNTDSWAVQQYQNPRSGVYWMIRTLNNRYLSQYNTIENLSCYGNEKATLCDRSQPVGHFVYASSPDHWHNNVTKCMSHVKGKYIPDDYVFRLRD